jgi:8-oxo-dGTP diphosphatase
MVSEIQVACALIEKEGKILAARRGPQMRHPGKWEFPGGKVMAGESLEACLKREIQEELGIEIEVLSPGKSIRHSYDGEKVIVLNPFLCQWKAGKLSPIEHDELRWELPKDLLQLQWLEADWPIVNAYAETQLGH